MVQLAIRIWNGNSRCTSYFNPQKDYDAIYDFAVERLGWCHEWAEELASWADLAMVGSEFYTSQTKSAIFYVERKCEIFLTEEDEE